MPKGVYDRSHLRVRPEAPEPNRTGVKVERDENWGSRERKVKGEVDYYGMLNMDEIPDDASYEWKSFSVAGKEDEDYSRRLRENGWSVVPHSRHEYMPKQGNAIVSNGLILMERPIELTQEARNEEMRLRNDRLQSSYDMLGKTAPGEMDRKSPNVSVKNQPMVIADDA